MHLQKAARFRAAFFYGQAGGPAGRFQLYPIQTAKAIASAAMARGTGENSDRGVSVSASSGIS